MCRAFHVVELAALHRPEKDEGDDRYQYEAQRNKQIQDIHEVTLLVAAHGIACLDHRAIKNLDQSGRAATRDKRMAFRTTSREESDMPMPAIHGVTWPNAAAGMATAL